MARISRDNPVLELARQEIAHAQLDRTSSVRIERHSLKGSSGPAQSAEAQAQNLADVQGAVTALQADGYDVVWRKARGATGIHALDIQIPADGMPVNAYSLNGKLGRSSKNPVLDLAHQEIAHAKLDGLKDAMIERHSLKGSRGPADSEAAQTKNLKEVKNAVAALRREGYEVDWHKAQGATGIHRLEISWWNKAE